MRPLPIDPEALDNLTAGVGIDTVRELADRTGISEWVLYKARRSGRMLPSHVRQIERVLGVERDAFVRQGVVA